MNKRLKRALQILAICLLTVLYFIVPFFLPDGYIINVHASTDLVYTPTRDIVFNETSSPTPYESFNLRNNTQLITGNYSANWSFENDTNGSVPAGFTDASGVGCDVRVNASMWGHNKVVELYDNGAGAVDLDAPTISNEQYGTVELWYGTTDANVFNGFDFTDGGTYLFRVSINTNAIRVWDGAWQSLTSAIANTWYHLQIDFECTAGGYLGLAQYDFRVSVNGEQFSDYDFDNNQAHLDTITFRTSTTGTGYSTYFDALGYSWNASYSIGDNILPIITSNPINETIDRFEFAFEGIDDVHDIGDDNPNGWTDIETGGGDSVNIGSLPLEADKEVVIACTGAGNNRGVYKDFADTGNQAYNLTVGFYYSVYTSATGQIIFDIDSSDSTLVSRIQITQAGLLRYYDGSGYNTLETGLTTNKDYEYNILINYYNDNAFIEIKEDGVIMGTHQYPLITAGKSGLGIIEFDTYTNDANAVTVYLDYIGAYVNGTSLVDDAYGFKSYDANLPTGNWDFNYQNLFSFNASGNFTILKTSTYYKGWASTSDVILDERQYNDTNVFYNTYERSDVGVTSDPFFVAFLQIGNWFENISYLVVEGASLVLGSTSYYPTITGGNININESYFYVSNSRLYGSITYDDSNTEYIQASFDIPNVSNENRSISYLGDTNGGYSQFRVLYTDSSLAIKDIPTTPYLTSFILTQTKTVDKFILIISDNDEFNATTTTVWVGAITLVWNPSVGVTLTTLNILGMVALFIMIMVPALALARKLGAWVILPAMLLFSLVLTMDGIMPLWLFVSIGVSVVGVFIVGKSWKKGE